MTIHFETDGPIARVTINRHDRLNAIDAKSADRLNSIWDAIEKDPHLRVVVLTGQGDRAFCAGADMKDDSGPEGIDFWALSPPTGFGGLSLRESLDIPVIGRVNGHALGGGMVMLLGCDVVVASSNATFGLTEPRVGRIPLDGGVALIVRQLPYVLATGLLLTGRRITAGEAMRYGLVNEVVPPDRLDEAVERWIGDILTCAPLSLRAIKQIARGSRNRSPAETETIRFPALIAALRSSDQFEGVRAFNEKREPRWEGR
jgi:enoyl-CoA hydratase/carnithine racemase